jgi:hypothetical protein
MSVSWPQARKERGPQSAHGLTCSKEWLAEPGVCWGGAGKAWAGGIRAGADFGCQKASRNVLMTASRGRRGSWRSL